jgi:hypothetical protein
MPEPFNCADQKVSGSNLPTSQINNHNKRPDLSFNHQSTILFYPQPQEIQYLSITNNSIYSNKKALSKSERAYRKTWMIDEICVLN